MSKVLQRPGVLTVPASGLCVATTVQRSRDSPKSASLTTGRGL